MNFNKINFFVQNRMSEPETDEFMHELIKKIADHEQRLKWEKILEVQYKIERIDLKKTSSKTMWISWRMVAAAALLLIVAGAGLFIALQKPGYQRLADNYLSRDKIQYAELRKGASDTPKQRDLAIEAYEKGDYSRAIEFWNAMKTSPYFNEDDLFYLGLSYCYNRQFEAAILVFDQHASLSRVDSRFSQERLFYQALALLELNRVDEARNKLLALSSNLQSPALLRKVNSLLDTIQ